jgi:hypothetical protein
VRPILALLAGSIALALPVGAPLAQKVPVPAGTTTTGKERLGDKASDNQRIDDCKVPPEKRGPIQRPTDCAH